jgi:hypothetical protein
MSLLFSPLLFSSLSPLLFSSLPFSSLLIFPPVDAQVAEGDAEAPLRKSAGDVAPEDRASSPRGNAPTKAVKRPSPAPLPDAPLPPPAVLPPAPLPAPVVLPPARTNAAAAGDVMEAPKSPRGARPAAAATPQPLIRQASGATLPPRGVAAQPAAPPPPPRDDAPVAVSPVRAAQPAPPPRDDASSTLRGKSSPGPLPDDSSSSGGGAQRNPPPRRDDAPVKVGGKVAVPPPRQGDKLRSFLCSMCRIVALAEPQNTVTVLFSDTRKVVPNWSHSLLGCVLLFRAV